MSDTPGLDRPSAFPARGCIVFFHMLRVPLPRIIFLVQMGARGSPAAGGLLQGQSLKRPAAWAQGGASLPTLARQRGPASPPPAPLPAL
eukprot:4106446-Pyramimonas_sp.AAC.1